MKLAVYYPDSWDEMGITVRVSKGTNERFAKVWFEMQEPRDSYEGEVECKLEDDEQ